MSFDSFSFEIRNRMNVTARRSCFVGSRLCVSLRLAGNFRKRSVRQQPCPFFVAWDDPTLLLFSSMSPMSLLFERLATDPSPFFEFGGLVRFHYYLLYHTSEYSFGITNSERQAGKSTLGLETSLYLDLSPSARILSLMILCQRKRFTVERFLVTY